MSKIRDFAGLTETVTLALIVLLLMFLKCELAVGSFADRVLPRPTDSLPNLDLPLR